jgi:PKD repeat protein
MKKSYIILTLLTIFLLIGIVQGATFLGTYQDYNKLQLHMNQTPFIDDLGQTVTNTGGVALNTTSKALGSGSAYYSGNYLKVSDAGSNFTFGTGDFSILAYFNSQSFNTKYFYDSAAGFRSYGYWVSNTAFNHQEGILSNTSNPISLNEWHQFFLKRESGVLFLFIDGNPFGSATRTTNYSGTGWVIGGNQAGNAGYTFLGGMDEINVWKGVAIANGTFWPQVYEVGTEMTPTASFTTSRNFIRIPNSITVTDTSTKTPTSWEWSWGDGSVNSTTQNPTHQYLKRGKFDIYLTATNAGGSGSTANPTSVKVVGYENYY